MELYPKLIRYKIERKIRDGTHSKLYLAVDSHGSHVAIKIFNHPSAAEDKPQSPLSLHFTREIATLCGPHHPNIIRLLDFGHTLDSGEGFLTLEWFHGQDLVSAMSSGSRLNFYLILVQACRALDYLHSRGLIHGDLKPDNFLVSCPSVKENDRPVLKLLDFEYASLRGLSEPHAFRGSPHYIAPEVIQGHPPVPESDLYSLGAILYQCLSGEPPFAGGDVGTVLNKHLHQHPPPLPRERSYGLDTLVSQLLAKEPARRPHSLAEVVRLINGASPEPPIPLNTTDTWLSRIRIPRAPSREDLYADMRTYLAKAFGDGKSSRPGLVLIHGERGMGTSQFLHESAVCARIIGFRTHLIRNASEHESLHHFHTLLSDPSFHGSPHPHFLAFDSRASQHPSVLLNHFQACTLPHPPTVFAISADGRSTPSPPATDPAHPPDAHDNIHHVYLKPFEAMDLRFTLGCALGVSVDHSPLIESLFNQTAGNPGRIAQLVAAALVQGILTVNQGVLVELVSIAEVVLPESVNEQFVRIFGSLDHSGRSVAMFLAAAGDHMSLNDISSLTGLVSSQVSQVCRVLACLGLISSSAQKSDQFTVSCGLVRRQILENVAPEDKRTAHRHLAEWYLTHPQRDRSAERAALSFHAAGIREAALTCSLRGGREAENRADYAAAELLYRCALASATREPIRRGEAILGLSNALTRLGRLPEAQQVLDHACWEPSWPPQLASGIELAKSTVAMHSGDYTLMERTARSAWRICSSANLRSQAHFAMVQWGLALCRQERRSEGLPLLYKSLARSRNVAERLTRAGATASIAEVHWKDGNYRRALGYQRRSTRSARASDPTAHSVAGVLNLGVLLCDLGRHSQARKTHRRALNIALRHSYSKHVGVAHVNIGETYRAQGKWRSALNCYRLALDIIMSSGMSFSALTAEYNIAQVLSKVGHLSVAVRFLRHRIALSRTRRWSDATSGLLHCWGGILRATGRSNLALRLYQNACRFAEQSTLHGSMLELRTHLALVHLTHGNALTGKELLVDSLRIYEARSPFDVRLGAHLSELQIDRALGLSAEAFNERLKPFLEKARKKRMAWHTTWALILRGEALLEAGRSDEAERDLTEATKIAQKNADRPQFWKASYWLGRVFEQRLQYERALGSYRVAALTVNELAMDIDDDRYREPFLAQPEVREVQARFERLRAEVGRKARHDIAAMSRSEKISRRMLNALNAIGQKLTSILDLDDLLTHLLDLSIENVRAERGMVFLWDDATGEMRLACARNMDKESLDEVSSFSRSVIKRVAEGHTLLEVDVGKDPALSAFHSLVIHEIKSILCVPMRTRGRTVGVIYLDTRRAAQMFTDKERTFVESFASQAAIAIENARVFGDINAENARLKREAAGRGRFENLIGTSAAMMRLSDTIAGVMGSDCNVLVAGESGTGKELVAKAIHYNGPRQKRKFVAIDCGALPESLLEAELFGFARGAFTGADRDKVGLIEESHGGTLFLDEITNTTVALQAKLLRVLQEHEVRRLGENSPRRVDARIIAATNANIASLIRDGKFRSDLFYRLNVVTIEVPPLRDRREDIPLLVEHFVRQLAPDEPSRRRLTPGVVEALGRYDWPGNVRELENVVERLLVLARGPIISQEALPENIRAAAGLRDLAAVARNAALDGGNNGQKTGEQMLVEDALRRFGGDKAKAARFIGWNRQKLYRKMKGFGIPAGYGRTV